MAWIKTVKINNKFYAEGFFESTEDKPKTIKDEKTQEEFALVGGTSIVEPDTGNVYFFVESDNDYTQV